MLGAELCFGAVDAGGLSCARGGGAPGGGATAALRVGGGAQHDVEAPHGVDAVCEVVLPASKSISNRVLLIKALACDGAELFGSIGASGALDASNVSKVLAASNVSEASNVLGASCVSKFSTASNASAASNFSAASSASGVSEASNVSTASSGVFAGLENLAECDDTDIMVKVLASASPAPSPSSEHHSCKAPHNGGATSHSEMVTSAEAHTIDVKGASAEAHTIDVGHAGTAMRFLTAYFAQREGAWILTGSERMKHRPIKILVDALNTLGGDIHYLGEEGYPPLKITGKRLRGGEIEVPASVSSQYISALMMVAPYMERGLSLKLVGSVASKSYIEMTAEIMRTFGVDLKIDGDCILIPHTSYKDTHFKVEADWSAASYIFEALSLADEGKILLPGLFENSLQGDAGQRPIWERLGVKSSFTERGLLLEKSASEVATLEEDFTLMPDLVQSFVVACCFKGIGFRFTGVETLRIKETDRIAALVTELAKFGFSLQVEGENVGSGKAMGDVNGGVGVADSCNVGASGRGKSEGSGSGSCSGSGSGSGSGSCSGSGSGSGSGGCVALSWHGEMVDGTMYGEGVSSCGSLKSVEKGAEVHRGWGKAGERIEVESYDDHRMAMAFAPAIIRMGSGLTIKDPMVVSKSFPTFWDELKKLGITVTLH